MPHCLKIRWIRSFCSGIEAVLGFQFTVFNRPSPDGRMADCFLVRSIRFAFRCVQLCNFASRKGVQCAMSDQSILGLGSKLGPGDRQDSADSERLTRRVFIFGGAAAVSGLAFWGLRRSTVEAARPEAMCGAFGARLGFFCGSGLRCRQARYGLTRPTTWDPKQLKGQNSKLRERLRESCR